MVIAEALYGPAGFYTAGGGAGRTRDFLTSPELGPLFGAVVARAIDAEWQRWGRPDPWIVVEAGAGAGTLAAAVLAGRPECAPALRYLMVEVSPRLRDAAAARLTLEEPGQLLGSHRPPDPDDESAGALDGQGPLVAARADLPAGPFTGMVIANELLDNLPFDIYERTSTGWVEVRVGLSGSSFIQVAVPPAVDVARFAPDAPVGARIPWQAAARDWVGVARALLERGSVVAIDYGRPTANMAEAGGWLRTYRSGGRGGAPLDDLGGQDITTDVATDQLPLARMSTQADWLREHGIGELREEAARTWRSQAAVGDLAALRARSRLGEADALCDLGGLGAFVVFEWGVGTPD